MRKKRGFTLIELLVVVAIIGLVASIILLNTQNQRFKAHDANIKSLLHQVRNAAELIYNKTGSYSQICSESDDTLRDKDELELLENAIQNENGGQNVSCFEGPGKTSFAVSSPLMAEPTKHWCVESAGASMKRDCAIFFASCLSICP